MATAREIADIAKSQEERALLNAIARDALTIVAAVITLLAFIFALWATVATLNQAKLHAKTERSLLEKIEGVEEEILLALNNNNRKR